MNFFDERVLAALKDSKSRSFAALLNEVGFSHNTLQQHLERLTAKGILSGTKLLQTVSEDPDSPITLHLGPQSRSMLRSKIRRWSWLPSLSVVSDTFAALRRAATAKKQRRTARLKSAPKPENKNYNHFTPIKGTSQRAFTPNNSIPRRIRLYGK
jgi:hypothetical protein